MWIELLAALSICLADWAMASSHMAYKTGQWHTWYCKPIPVLGDRFHAASDFRYPALCLLAFLAFGTQWYWYVGTASCNFIGWQTLKRLHGKDWGIFRRWFQ
tara:strand:+ start:1451 stop:1756 length:306 start_codon:yes stop_codon:yes gene_type:complete